MRVNVYAEEMTDRVELVEKEVEGETFVGVRFYLELPVTRNGAQVQGPFMHRPGDDDSSAVTFWGKRDLYKVLGRAQQLLYDRYYVLERERTRTDKNGQETATDTDTK